MWNNKLTELLNIDYPIIQAGMANVSGYKLASTISNCGGLGTIGAGYMSAETLKNEIKKTKKLTHNSFAVNLFIPSEPEYNEAKIRYAQQLLVPYNTALGIPPVDLLLKDENTEFLEKINIIIEEAVPVVSFTFGLPATEIVMRLREEGIRLIGTATNAYEAKLNAKIMDAVVVQGSEAGGHRGTFTEEGDTMIGLMALVPEVADTVDIPVIAAGGIVDNRGVHAALTLGASGVQLGSLFLNTLESTAPDIHKSLIKKGYNQTTITKTFSGKDARAIQNVFTSEMKPHEDKLPDYPIQNALTSLIRKEAGQKANADFLSLWSGQGRVENRNNVSASTIFQSLIR